jgi:hypothetical protein
MIFKWTKITGRYGSYEAADVIGKTRRYRVAVVSYNSARSKTSPDDELYIGTVAFFGDQYSAKRATQQECRDWATAKLNELIEDLA